MQQPPFAAMGALRKPSFWNQSNEQAMKISSENYRGFNSLLFPASGGWRFSICQDEAGAEPLGTFPGGSSGSEAKAAAQSFIDNWLKFSGLVANIDFLLESQVISPQEYRQRFDAARAMMPF